ncbi:glycoside hydrolase family 32 protein, partial [Vibrio makurazakiensis]|uniref:glycoside hydrolase family 32 protein n=1 Tax=Vibrio makurazakiensis TaxID=2910250 RepID=UPI003D0C8A24
MRELKYRTIDTATNNEILKFETIRENKQYRPLFHVNPPFGLLNDPNGFCYFDGKYHLFYQWFPFGIFHGLKHWMHLTSDDLYQWSEEGTKITPNENYESHGAYSGSALIEDDNAYLFYTGNIKSDDARDANQCLALLDNKNSVTKSVNNPIIKSVPKGYTGHVRDPKIIKHQGQYIMILGAQREEDLKGCIIVYRSNDLLNWTFSGELSINVEGSFDQAYMFECPDLLEVDGKDVLIFSPQGIEASGERFHNRYNVVYCVGQVDWSSLTFNVEHWDELDRGFDFYAPQTMANSPIGPTLIAWAGTDETLPTQELGWVNSLTLPRTLSLKNNRLYQIPVGKEKGTTRNILASNKLNEDLTVKLDSLSFELDINGIENLTNIS